MLTAALNQQQEQDTDYSKLKVSELVDDLANDKWPVRQKSEAELLRRELSFDNLELLLKVANSDAIKEHRYRAARVLRNKLYDQYSASIDKFTNLEADEKITLLRGFADTAEQQIGLSDCSAIISILRVQEIIEKNNPKLLSESVNLEFLSTRASRFIALTSVLMPYTGSAKNLFANAQSELQKQFATAIKENDQEALAKLLVAASNLYVLHQAAEKRFSPSHTIDNPHVENALKIAIDSIENSSFATTLALVRELCERSDANSSLVGTNRYIEECVKDFGIQRLHQGDVEAFELAERVLGAETFNKYPELKKFKAATEKVLAIFSRLNLNKSLLGDDYEEIRKHSFNRLLILTRSNTSIEELTTNAIFVADIVKCLYNSDLDKSKKKDYALKCHINFFFDQNSANHFPYPELFNDTATRIRKELREAINSSKIESVCNSIERLDTADTLIALVHHLTEEWHQLFNPVLEEFATEALTKGVYSPEGYLELHEYLYNQTRFTGEDYFALEERLIARLRKINTKDDEEEYRVTSKLLERLQNTLDNPRRRYSNIILQESKSADEAYSLRQKKVPDGLWQKTQKTISNFNEALLTASREQRIELLTQRANLQEKINNPAGAAHDLLKVAELAKEAGNQELAIETLFRTGKIIYSLDRVPPLEEALSLAPDRLDILLLLSEAYLLNGKEKEAYEHIERYLVAKQEEEDFQSSPEFALAMYIRGVSSLAAGDYKEARDSLESARKSNTGIRQRLVIGELYWLYTNCPDNSIRDEERSLAIRAEYERTHHPRIRLTESPLSTRNSVTMIENYNSAMRTILDNIPDIRSIHRFGYVSDIYSVPDITAFADVLNKTGVAKIDLESLKGAVGYSVFSADENTGQIAVMILLDEKVLLDESSAVMVLNHELRHLVDNVIAYRDKNIETDSVKREIPVYRQTIKDLTVIAEAWKKQGRATDRLEQRINDQRIQLERYEKDR